MNPTRRLYPGGDEVDAVFPPPETKSKMASGNGTTLMQEIYDQFLICKICFETYKRPKTLSCLHIFCTDCLEKHMEAELERSYRYMLYSRAVSCPICRKKTELPSGGVRRLPDNFLVGNLTEVVNRRMPNSDVPLCEICQSGVSKQAVSKCLDCSKFLCTACVDLHKRTKVTASHSLFDTEVEKDIECKVHQGEVVRFYCEACEMCICVLCTFQEHKGHNVVPFTEGMEKYRNSLDTLVLSCRERITKLKDHLDLINNVESEVRQTEEQIRDTAISSIAAIRKRERQMKQDLYDTFGEDTFEYLKEKVALQESLDNLISTCNLTDIVVKDNSIELLLLKKEIQDKLNLQLQRRIQEPPKNIRKQVKFLPGTPMFGVLDVDGNQGDYGRENMSRKNWSGCDFTMQTDDPSMEESFTTMGKEQCYFDTAMWTQTDFESMQWESTKDRDTCGTSKCEDVETSTQSTMTHLPNLVNIETMTDTSSVIKDFVNTETMTDNITVTKDLINTETMTDNITVTKDLINTETMTDNNNVIKDLVNTETMTDNINVMKRKVQTDSVHTSEQETETDVTMEMHVDEMNNLVNHINGCNGWLTKRDQFTNTKQYITCDRQTLTITKNFREQMTDTAGLVQFSDQQTVTDVSSAANSSHCQTWTDRVNRCNKSTLTNVPLTADKVTSTIRKQQMDQTTCTPYVISLDMGIMARVPGEDKAIGTKTIVTMDASVGGVNANARTCDVGVETMDKGLPEVINRGTMYDTEWNDMSTFTDLTPLTERATSPHRVFMVDTAMETTRVKHWSSSTNTRTYSVEDLGVGTDPIAPSKAVCKDSQTDLSFAFGMLKKNVIPCHKGTFTEQEHLTPLFNTEEKAVSTLEYSLADIAVGTQHMEFDDNFTSTHDLVDLVESGCSPDQISTRHIDVNTDKACFADTGSEAYSPATCEIAVAADIRAPMREKFTSTYVSTNEIGVSATLPSRADSADFGVNVDIPVPSPQTVPKTMVHQGINVNTYTPDTPEPKIMVDQGVTVNTYISGTPEPQSLPKTMVDQCVNVNTYTSDRQALQPVPKTMIDQGINVNTYTSDTLPLQPEPKSLVDQGINVNIPFEVQSPVSTRETGVSTDFLSVVDGDIITVSKTTSETGVTTVSPALVHTATRTDEMDTVEPSVAIRELQASKSQPSGRVLVDRGTLAYAPSLRDAGIGDGDVHLISVHKPDLHMVSTATGDGDVRAADTVNTVPAEIYELYEKRANMVHSSTMTPVSTCVDSHTAMEQPYTNTQGTCTPQVSTAEKAMTAEAETTESSTEMLQPFTRTVETSTPTVETACKETSAEQPAMEDQSTMTFIERRNVAILKRPQVVSRGFMAQPVQTREKQTLTMATKSVEQGCNTEKLTTVDKETDVKLFSTVTKGTCTDPKKMVENCTKMAPVLLATRHTSPLRPVMSDRGSSPVRAGMKDVHVTAKASTRECETYTTPAEVRTTGTEMPQVSTSDRQASPVHFASNNQGTSMPQIVTKNAASSTQLGQTVDTGTAMPQLNHVDRETTPVRWPVNDQEVSATVDTASKNIGTPVVDMVEAGTGMPRIRMLDSSTDMPPVLTSEKETCTALVHLMHKNVATDSILKADKQTEMTVKVDVTAAYMDGMEQVKPVLISRGTCMPQASFVDRDTSPPPQRMEERATSPLHTFTKDKGVYVTRALLLEPRETFQKAGNVKKVLKAEDADDGRCFSPGLAPIREDSKESTPEEEDRLPNGAMLMRSVATCTNSPVITHVEKFWSPGTGMGENNGSTFTTRGTGPTSSIVCKVEMGTNTMDYAMANKQTCTPPIAMMDKAISTESVSVDTKMAECISKLRTVRQRLEQQTTQGPSSECIDSGPIYSRASMTGTQTMALTSVTPTLRGFTITSTKQQPSARPITIGRSKSLGEKLNEKEGDVLPFMTPELPRRKSVQEKLAEEKTEKENDNKKPSLARKLRLDMTQMLRSSSAPERPGGLPSFPKVRAVKAQVIPKLDVSAATTSSPIGLGSSSVGVGSSSVGLGSSSVGVRSSSVGVGTSSVGVGSSSVGVGSSSVGLGSSSVGLGPSSVGVGTSSIGVGTPSKPKLLREHRQRHRRLGTSRDVKSPTPPSLETLPKRKLLADGPDLAKARLAKQKQRLEKQQAVDNPAFQPMPLMEEDEEEEEEEARDSAPAPLGPVSRLISRSPVRRRPVTSSPTRRPVPFRPLGADEQARRRGKTS